MHLVTNNESEISLGQSAYPCKCPYFLVTVFVKKPERNTDKLSHNYNKNFWTLGMTVKTLVTPCHCCSPC